MKPATNEKNNKSEVEKLSDKEEVGKESLLAFALKTKCEEEWEMREKQKKSIQSHRSLVLLFQTARDICERFENTKQWKWNHRLDSKNLARRSPKFTRIPAALATQRKNPSQTSDYTKASFFISSAGNLVCLHHQNVKETRKEEEKRVCFLGRTENKETPSSEWNVLMVRRI